MGREQAGVASTFVRFHPLLQNQGVIHTEELAPTIGWRLDHDLLAEMHPKHRNVVRKAQSAGLGTEANPGVGQFQPLYEETMERAGADQFYFFPPEYWTALDRLGDGLMRFDAYHDEEVVASALCLASPPWLHYHLGAASEIGRKLGATTFLLYEIARWAQERGYSRFHLGGGVGGGRDSLHEFKRRFDPGGELPDGDRQGRARPGGVQPARRQPRRPVRVLPGVPLCRQARRVSSMNQFGSNVAPLSNENDCVQRADDGVMSVQS